MQKYKPIRNVILLALYVLMLLILPVPETLASAENGEATVNMQSDKGHGAGCTHSHNSGCYTYHTHTSGCYAWIGHSWVPDLDMAGPTFTFCDKCKSNANTSAVSVYCSRCKSTSGAGHTYCNNCRYINGGNSSGQCTQQIFCGQSTQTLNCTKNTYAECILPSIASAASRGWTNAATDTISLTGSNITAVNVNGKGFIDGQTFSATANGAYTVQVKSNTGHIKVYTVTVNNFDRDNPAVPIYVLSK